MRFKIILFGLVSFFLLFSSTLQSQAPGDIDGGNIKFEPPGKMTVLSISGELTRCETYMDYYATQGFCRSFPEKIGYVKDFSIGYRIVAYPADYDVGDSFIWNFYGPNK